MTPTRAPRIVPTPAQPGEPGFEPFPDRATWAVVHRLRAGRRVLSVPRLFIAGVPAGTSRADVIEVLELAGQAPLYSDGGVPWANHVVLPEPRWPEEWSAAAGPAPRRVPWADLAAPTSRRAITLKLSPALWARLRLAADGAGMSLQAWCERALSDAAGAPPA